MEVLVITPSVGRPELAQAIKSVKDQIFDGKISHVIVSDGREHYNKVFRIAWDLPIVALPDNVGSGGFYGHRVYAAMSHLLSEKYKYVFFLDDDNWFEPSHIQTCVDLAEKHGLDFSYALRAFYTHDGKFFADDNCASLGKWKIWDNGGHYLVDTNAYCFRREFIEKYGGLWHARYAADRLFYESVKEIANHECTGKRTVSYRLGKPEDSKYQEELDFILSSNKMSFDKYGGTYPWENLLSTVDSNHEPAD